MLKEIQLTNFKSFGSDAKPIRFSPVTILVGANGSGKSNLLDAIRFLQGLGAGFTLSEIFSGKYAGGREVAPGLRGGIAEACMADKGSFTIKTEMELPDYRHDGENHYRHELTCRISRETHEAQIETEKLQTTSADSSHTTEIVSEDTIRSHPFPRQRSVLTEIIENVKIGADTRAPAGWLLNAYEDGFRFLDVQPAEMKGYVPLSVEVLGEHGENLSAELYRLAKKPEKKREFLDWIAELCAPRITDLDFEKTRTDRVQVRLEEEGAGYISAESLSDGTLRFMAILAAMYSAPEGTIFLMEEIENGLHPTRVHLLVELLEQFAEARGLQVIATTHSSQVLLSLSEQALDSAILFARPEGARDTKTCRLGELSHYHEVTDKTEIDKLFSTGWLEFAL